MFGVDVPPSVVMIVDGDADGDGLDNAEDPCPLVAGSTADADEDGVGDDCDPDVDDRSEPDCLVLFDGFDVQWGGGHQPPTATLDPRWNVIGSDPTFQSSGSLLFVDGTSPTIFYASGPFEATEITIKFYVANPGPGNTRSFGLLLAPDVGDDANGDVCALIDDNSSINTNPAVLDWAALSSVSGYTTRAPTELLFDFEGFSGELRWSPGKCSVNAGAGGAAYPAETGGPGRMNGAIGIRAADLSVELSAIVAYSKSCP